MCGQYMLIVLVGILLAGCKDDNSKAVVEDAISGDTVVSKEDLSTSPSEPTTSIEPNALVI